MFGFRATAAVAALICFTPGSSAVADQAIRCDQANVGTLDYARLTNMIKTCDVRSIDQLLALLPEDYRGSFTLMRRSNSLQGASDLNPRVILFGKDAKLMIAFNGDPSQKGYQSLEVIRFNDSDKNFQFSEIEFSSNTASKPAIKENPASCLSCHRNPPRPNWESYDFWPGAYGSNSDHILKGSAEDSAFKAFLAKRRNKGRYRYLVGPSDLRGPSINELEGFVPRDPVAYFVKSAPNFRLSFFINQLNYQRIGKLIRETPDFEKYKYAIYGALFNCEPIESFLPQSVAGTFVKSPQFFVGDTENKLEAQFTRKTQGDPSAKPITIGDPRWPDSQEKTVHNDELNRGFGLLVSKLRYLLENRGVETRDWSTSFDPEGYTFSDGEIYFRDLVRQFQSDLDSIPGLRMDYTSVYRKDDEKLFGAHNDDFKGLKRLTSLGLRYDDEVHRRNCALLKELSLAAFGASQKDCSNCGLNGSPVVAPPALPAAREAAGKLSPFARCQKCHSGPEPEAPSIPFDDNAKLKKALSDNPRLFTNISRRVNASDSEKMPPDENLSSSEIKELIDYLKTLKNSSPRPTPK